MTFTFFWSVALFMILSFAVTKRKLHFFEVLLLWVFVLAVLNNVIWLVGLNAKLILYSQNMGDFLALDALRSVIIPVFIILFLEIILVEEKKSRQLFYWAGTIIMLVGIEYMADFVGVINHIATWKWWWSFAWWTAFVLLSYAVHRLIRRIAIKDVRI